jgi:hypothetical protein
VRLRQSITGSGTFSSAACADAFNAANAANEIPNHDASPKYPARDSVNHGSLKSKVKSSMVMMRLLSEAKASALETFAYDDGIKDDSDEEGDSDGECCIDKEGNFHDNRFMLERRTSSMRHSIQDYDGKLEEVQKLVQSGTVVIEHQKNSRPDVEIQANLVVYEHDKLLLRSTIKRSPAFSGKIQRVCSRQVA